MKFLSILLVLGLFTGCLRVSGKMDVKEHIVYKDRGHTEVILAGEYQARATFKGQNKIVVDLSNDLQKQQLTLKFPVGTILPRDNGEFSVNNRQLNQPFSVTGSFKTETNYSDVVEVQESCQISQGTVCDDFEYGPSYPNRCHVEYTKGLRDVKFRTLSTVKTLTFNVTQDEQTKATFNGKNADEKKDYLFVGPCTL